MRYLRIILIAVGAGSVVYFFFVFNQNNKENKIQNSNPQQQINLDTKTDEQGQVTVKVTPQVLNTSQWRFNIVFDTHSVELNQDLLQTAELVDSQGKVYKPIAWEGDKPGAHHREGMLIFNPIQPVPEYIELKIKNVGDITERSFRWNTKF